MFSDERDLTRMERNREGKRGNMTAMNGSLPRKKQRSSSVLRDYPEDGVMEMHERLRDRGAKKDRDRDRDRERLSRSKRRRVERMMHGSGGHRDDMEESSEESIEEEMDDDEVLEKPPQNHQHQHQQQTLRVPPWDEINVSIPRKARTRGATAKRSHEHWVSGGGGGGCSGSGAGGEGEQPSPVRSSPSATQISPPSSKIKQFNGSNQHAHETAKDPSTADELEIAELLTGMRSHEDHSVRFTNRDANGVSNEQKSPVRDQSPANPSSMAAAPKRRRPRHAVKYDDECQPSTLRFSPAKVVEDQPAQEEPALPKSESLGQFLSNENGGSLQDLSALRVVDGEPKQEKLDSSVVTAASNREESKEQAILPQKEATSADFGRTVTTTFYATSPATKNLRKDKVTIDLMAPPDGSSDFISDDRPVAREVSEVSTEKREAKVSEREAVNQNGGESLLINGGKTEKSITSEDFGLKKQLHKGKTLDLHKGKTLDLQLDLENSDQLASNKHDPPKQPVKSSMGDPHSGKTGPPSLSMPTTVAGWPGSFPQFGYMGQVPPFQAIMPAMDAAAGSRSILQKLPSHPVRRKRCSLHGYIAQSIEYHQKMMQMNPYYPASAGAAQLFGPRPSSNLNGMPAVDPLLGNPFQGSYPGRSLQDTKGAPIFTTFTGHPLNVNTTEAAHRTQLVLQQMPPQPGSANNMIPSPALFYPINQHQAVAAGAAAAAAAAVRSGAEKSSLSVGTATSSSGMSSSAVASSGGGGSAVAMNYGCSPEQYLAMLQNGGYPIPIPAHVGGPPSYRGGAPSSSMPLFGGPFFQSQMLHLSQLQQKQHQQQYQQLPLLASAPQKPPHSQPSHQNTSTSSGSSSSQKHQQMLQQGSGGGTNGAGTNSNNLQSKKQHPQLPNHHARQMESKLACEDGPSSSDSRALQAPKTAKSLYNHNMAMPMHPQNAAAVAPAAAASTLSNGAGYHEKQPTQQQQPALKADLTSSQAFAMSYAANNGGATPSGIDYSSVAQGHAMFHSFPEMARHGYPMNMAAAAAVATSVQQKKANSQAIQGGKSAGSSVINTNNVGHEERKMMSASFKSHGINGMQHTSSFSKTDKEPQINNFMGNSVIESSSGRQATNQASANSARPANRSTNTTISPGSAQSNPNFQQFQLHRQAELQMQHHMASARAKSTSGNNGGVYPERAPSGSTTPKFPQTMTGFQQGFAHSGSPSQPPQWKPSGRTGTATPTTSADPFASRNHPQQQAKSGITSSHHTHISFSPNAVKMPAGAQHPPGSGTTNVHASSAATPTATGDIGSPSHSISKSTGGSPRASTSEKPTSGANTQALSGQSYTKISASNSSRKSSPNRNASSNLGNPQQINPVTNSSNGGKQLSQLPQFRLQPQQLTQKRSQLLFSNGTYMQAHTSQSATAASAAAAANFYKQQTEQLQAHTSQSTTAASAAAAANFYKQQTEQQQQYQNQSSNPASSGLTLVGTSATSDPSKTSTTNANSMKGMPPPGLLHAAQLAAAAGTGHPLMSAMFPYMPMPSTAAKPGDQKPAAGNDNLNASWQPEKKA